MRVLFKFMLTLMLCFGAAFAASNNAYAQFNAPAETLFLEAKAFHDGDGVEQDLIKARALYEQSAALGHNFARINLGYMHFLGEGAPQDYEKSLGWYYLAARDGNSDARKMMAVFYEKGLGVERDTFKAQSWRKAPHIKPAAEASPAAKTAQPKAVASIADIKPPVKAALIEVKAIPKAIIPKSGIPKSKGAIYQDALPVLTPAIAAPSAQVQIKSVEHKPAPESQNALPPASAPQDIIATRPSGILSGKSLGLIIFLLSAGLCGALWLFTSRRAKRHRHDRKTFALAFHEKHKTALRSTYKGLSERQKQSHAIDDTWPVSLCVMVLRFAQEHNQTGYGYDSVLKTLSRAARSDPLKARREAYRLYPRISKLIALDAGPIKPLDKSIKTPQLSAAQ